MSALVPRERMEQTILLIRGHRVMLDADLAHLYGVTTKRLNEQVKRNRNRLPTDFMFQLTSKEKAEVVANCDHLTKLKFSPAKPLAFTEHGAVMVASVLNSKRAIEVSIYVVRAFVKVREVLGSHRSPYAVSHRQSARILPPSNLVSSHSCIVVRSDDLVLVKV